MNELQAGAKLSLAVFPQSLIFLQPREAAFDYPMLGHRLEGTHHYAWRTALSRTHPEFPVRLA